MDAGGTEYILVDDEGNRLAVRHSLVEARLFAEVNNVRGYQIWQRDWTERVIEEREADDLPTGAAA